MTTPLLDLAERPRFPDTFAGRLAQYFSERPLVWLDGRQLAQIAGVYAWRSRCADLRRAPFSMTIENRQRRVKDGEHEFVVSEYRYVP